MSRPMTYRRQKYIQGAVLFLAAIFLAVLWSTFGPSTTTKGAPDAYRTDMR